KARRWPFSVAVAAAATVLASAKQRYFMGIQLKICFSMVHAFGDCLDPFDSVYLSDYLGNRNRNKVLPLASCCHPSSYLCRLHLATLYQRRLYRLDTSFSEKQ